MVGGGTCRGILNLNNDFPVQWLPILSSVLKDNFVLIITITYPSFKHHISELFHPVIK